MNDVDKNRLRQIKAQADFLYQSISELAEDLAEEYPVGTDEREEVFDNPIREIAKNILEAADVDDCGACPLCQC
jgi:hypothetical protein